MQRIEIIVQGRVQGIFFRVSIRDKARQLGLKGWVKNEDYNKVHIIAEGDEGSLKELIKFARQGPPSADVKDIDVNHKEYTGEFTSFEIRY